MFRPKRDAMDDIIDQINARNDANAAKLKAEKEKAD